MQIAVWSNSNKSGTTLNACVLATVLAARHGYKTFLTHTLMNTIKMEKYLLKPQERQKKINIGDSSIEALLRTCRNGKLSSDILHNFCQSLLSHSNLDLLDSQESFEETEEENISFLYYLKVAKRFYDISVVDIDTKVSRELQQKILEDSDVLLMISTPDQFELEQLRVKKKEIEEQNKSVRIIVGINRYDERSGISKNKLITGFDRKKTFLLPYQVELQDHCNRSDLLDFVLRQLNSKRKDEMAEYINRFESMVKEILLSYQQEENKEEAYA
ncbi:MAG: hypothetical protein JW708_02130 [Vallitaleaceae bacterium]|nr:hypothetical protein [Vallitaleaceae bacterium]